ncbi:MAG TPA: molybdopterin-dependent oxidoreductase [Gemmatimonadaceae bacterium]|nr:molybdopterin-dependent oxidoreductase [Gemmatimonadaceae bacterium]
MAEQKMVNLTVEGRPVSVPEGTTILEAAKTVGVLIPHYCYHPGLPVAGVCRMCLVEVEKAPKLAPSCATTVAEGQVVHVHSEKSLEARKGVLEMLLINHPLDCPICDQSGECELQDYTYQEGREDSRYREPKRFNPAEDFGGDVIYVPNRCILCTRCVRFMDDVAHEPTLNVSERGDRAVIGKFEGRDMTHPWAANVIDLCPVGALLSKDFLNKARAWELDRTASICPNCTQGCNIIMETRENQLVRMRPRPNEYVNAFFMCDWGRQNYRWMNEKNRVERPMVRNGAKGLTPTNWENAISAAARVLAGKKTFVVASPMLSNESLYLLTEVMQGGSGAFRVVEGEEAPLPGVEDLSLRRERAANVYGAETLGFKKTKDVLAGLGQGDVLVIAGEDLSGIDASALSRAGEIIVVGSVMPGGADRASVVLPIANFSEEEGTVTNLRGRVQRFTQARQAPGETRPSWLVLGDLLGAMGKQSSFFLPSEVFARLASSHKSFAGLSYDTIGFKGLPVVDAPQTGPKAPIAVGAA